MASKNSVLISFIGVFAALMGRAGEGCSWRDPPERLLEPCSQTFQTGSLRS